MSVIVELANGTTHEHIDRSERGQGNAVRFWYKLHQNGALLVRRVATTSETEFVEMPYDEEAQLPQDVGRVRAMFGPPEIDVIYGPAHWVSVRGDDEGPSETGWP